MARRKTGSRRTSNKRHGRGALPVRPTSYSLPRLSTRYVPPVSRLRPSPRYVSQKPRRATVQSRRRSQLTYKGFKNVFRTLSPTTLFQTSNPRLHRAVVCARRKIRKEVVFASGYGGRNNFRDYSPSRSRLHC